MTVVWMANIGAGPDGRRPDSGFVFLAVSFVPGK